MFDWLVDRRKLRRKLTFWRVLSAIGFLFLLLSIGINGGSSFINTPHIARVNIEGIITGKQDTIDLLRRAAKSSAKAVILRINSGGGTTTGSEALYNEIRRLAKEKPVVAVIDEVGASGAYMAALGADRIFSSGTSIVGSIGVIAQYPNVSSLLDKLGVNIESVRSTPLKALPNGLEPTPPEAVIALQSIVLDTYSWFVDLVGSRRNIEGDKLKRVVDGRVFTGRQALELQLIDEIGGELEAVAWLEKEKNIAKEIEIHSYMPDNSISGIGKITSFLKSVPIFSSIFINMEEKFNSLLSPVMLDGLVSVWHPSGG